MEKFSKKKKKVEKKSKDEILYEDNYMKVLKGRDEWSFVAENDNVCCIPILTEYNQILVRREIIPPYKYNDGKDYHLTAISGTVEEGETPEETVRRELVEEAGIMLKDNYVIEIYDSLYKNKGNTSKYHLVIIPLMEYEYSEVAASGDGSKLEKESSTVKVNIKNIKQLIPSDIVTRMLLNDVMDFLNISH